MSMWRPGGGQGPVPFCPHPRCRAAAQHPRPLLSCSVEHRSGPHAAPSTALSDDEAPPDGLCQPSPAQRPCISLDSGYSGETEPKPIATFLCFPRPDFTTLCLFITVFLCHGRALEVSEREGEWKVHSLKCCVRTHGRWCTGLARSLAPSQTPPTCPWPRRCSQLGDQHISPLSPPTHPAIWPRGAVVEEAPPQPNRDV